MIQMREPIIFEDILDQIKNELEKNILKNNNKFNNLIKHSPL